MAPTTTTADLPNFRDLGPDDAAEAYDRRHLGDVPLDALVGAVGAVLARPKVAPADSFVLHSSLELLARASLLRLAGPEGQDTGRRRLVWLAAAYAAAGEELPDPRSSGGDLASRTTDEVATRLVAALGAGDLDDIDRCAAALADRATPTELRRHLGPTVATSLAAAAHGSIFLSLLPRVQDGPGGLAHGLRGLARDLGRHPDWQLRWFEDTDPDDPPAPTALADALLDVPMLGPAGNNFIKPMMSQAEDSGIAAKLLAGTLQAGAADVPRVRAELSRIAAWSMLQEPGGHAYGWTHCLTMPQAVLALAGDAVDPRAAVAVAATHVVGFRAAVGERAIQPTFDPAPAAVAHGGERLPAAIERGRDAAAAHGWAHAGPALARELAARAAAHHDAHYAKYTLACLDAAADDPAEARLYFAAAAFLAAYWHEQGDDGFLRTSTAT